MKTTMVLRNLTTLVVGSGLLTLVSCGNNNNKKVAAKPTINPVEARQETTGKYRASLQPINPAVSAAFGSAELMVTEDRFSVSLKMSNLDPSVSHRQAIYASDKCPKTAAEAAHSILIPLDGDLSSQSAAGYGFPFSDSYGNYSYIESTERSVMMAELKSGAAGPEGMVRLTAGAALNLAGKVIVVRGTMADEGLPVACGKIVRVGDVATNPGTKM